MSEFIAPSLNESSTPGHVLRRYILPGKAGIGAGA
jgi:hypothetical protein